MRLVRVRVKENSENKILSETKTEEATKSVREEEHDSGQGHKNQETNLNLRHGL